MSEPTEVQDAVASTLATPFAQPIITASTSKAQKQREYRQRIKASRTPAQVAAARKSKNERQRNNRLRQAANLAIASNSLATTNTSPSRSGEESNNVQTGIAPKTRAQIQREYRQRIAASKTPAQAAAAREARNVRDRNNRLRQAANLVIASGSLEATTTSSSRSGEESNNVQTRSQRQHAQQQSTTTADQHDERVNLPNVPLFPAIPVPMEVQEAVASTSATLFAEPTSAAPKTRAQIQPTAQKPDVEANSWKNEENAEDRADSRSDTLSASPVEHIIIKTENLYDYMEDMTMYEDDAACAAETDAVTAKEEVSYHISQCSVCNEEITEFRYTCVQCSNFDLCSSCEMNRAHHHHYVLRVPHPTPNEEVDSVLTVIRLHLLKDLDPIKELKQEEITIKMEEIPVECEVQSELVEDDVKSEDMDKIIEARVPPQTTEQDMHLVDEFKSNNYKYCGVPLCLSTTVKTPGKLFINVPTEKSMRDKWLKLARRDPATLNPYTTFHFCEDHFDLPNDMENYMQYHIMGSVSQIRMKKGCVPSKFDCHPDWSKRPCTAQESYILEKRRKLMIQDCDSESGGSNSGHFIAGATSNSKTAEKSTQVHLRYQFRSKAVQTPNKLVSRTTSPFRIIYKSVSTSPCKIESLTDSIKKRNSTKARKKIRN